MTLQKILVGTIALATASAVLAYGFGGQARPPLEAPVAAAAASSGPAFLAATPFAVSDAAGDAEDVGVDGAAWVVAGCRLGCGTTRADTSSASTEGAWLDILRVGFEEERREDFTLSLTISKLDEGIPELDAVPLLNRVALFQACYAPPGLAAPAGDPQGLREPASPLNEGERCAILTAARSQGQLITAASFHVYSGACNEVKMCEWDVPYEIAYGSPGTIRFVVPKTYAAHDRAALAIESLWGRTDWVSSDEILPAWHAAYNVHADAAHYHGHVGTLGPWNQADMTARHDLEAPAELSLPTQHTYLEGPTLGLAPGFLYGGDAPLFANPELDLLALDLREEGEELVARYTLASLEDGVGVDLQYLTLLGFSGGNAYEFGFYRFNGKPYGYAGHCISSHCEDSYMVEVPFAIAPGSPGTLEVRVPKSAIGAPAAAAETNFVLAFAAQSLAYADDAALGGPLYADAHNMVIVDGGVGGKPFVFEGPALEPLDGHDHVH